MTDHDVVVATPPANNNDDGRLDQSIAEELVARARADGIDLVGPGGRPFELSVTMVQRASTADHMKRIVPEPDAS